MEYLFIFIIIIVLTIVFFFKNRNNDDDKNVPELFSTKEFNNNEGIKSAKCPQCGKIATTYNDIKKNFGLRKVGYTTDIQSWCRECRQNKEEIKKSKLKNNDLNLFNE